MTESEYDFLAEAYLFTQEEGGRNRPIMSTEYRATLVYDGTFYEAREYVINHDNWLLGETRTIGVRLLTPSVHVGNLYPGKSFELWEGRQVARGTITSVREYFLSNAYHT